jgi:hypothetical protein
MRSTVRIVGVGLVVILSSTDISKFNEATPRRTQLMPIYCRSFFKIQGAGLANNCIHARDIINSKPALLHKSAMPTLLYLSPHQRGAGGREAAQFIARRNDDTSTGRVTRPVGFNRLQDPKFTHDADR